MTTIVTRSRNKHAKGLLNLSDDARRRAREYLKSAGIRVEKLHPLIWPEDAVSAHRESTYDPWKFTTKSDILRQKRERMKRHLRRKREYGVIQRRLLYVWVFWCPGAFGFAYKGWWTYLIGLKREYHGGGYKGNVEGNLFNEIMKMFPVENPHPLYPINDNEWMQLFAKQYQRGRWCGKPQGKSLVWAEVKGGSVVRLLNRTKWPARPDGAV